MNGKGNHKLFVRLRLDQAPLRAEREQYLTHLTAQGTNESHVRVIASRLLHINRLLNLTSLRTVNSLEVDEAVAAWLVHIGKHQSRGVASSSAFTFRNATTNWLRFHKLLAPSTVPKRTFDSVISDFMYFIEVTRGMSRDSIHNHRAKISLFLAWVDGRHSVVSDITLNDVDDYLEIKRKAGLKSRSMAAHCQSLRTFFRYANLKGWSEAKISQGIKSPPISNYESTPRGPAWADVRRLLEAPTRNTPAATRTAAILSLCAIYGLRGIEVRSLRIEDFDWVGETFSVQRAKGGKVQQFPLQFEVGEAILLYLRHGRPTCSTRRLFVTLKPPYRSMNQSVLATIIKRRMKLLNIQSHYSGSHSLRHSCATQLLHEGSSLVEIADFMGHRNIKSVSVYAKLDQRSLRQVADFSLFGVL